MYSSTHHHGKKFEQGGERVKVRSRFLLVLDDIEDAHVDFLFDISSDFDCGNSRYIVISRNKEILDRCIVTSRHEDVGARVLLESQEFQRVIYDPCFFLSDQSESITVDMDKLDCGEMWKITINPGDDGQLFEEQKR